MTDYNGVEKGGIQMKKIMVLLVLMTLGMTAAACGNDGFDASQRVSVYTRDTTSGTRDGFMKGIGFDEASANDSVLVEGFATSDNNGIMQSMTVDEYGIGYISLASLNDTVKGLGFNGVEPTVQNVVDDLYDLKRPFMYMLRADDDWESPEIKEIAHAFVAFLHSIDGGDIINDQGAVSLPSNYTWESVRDTYPICQADNTGLTLRFGGSDSIQRIAEALSAEFSPRCGNVVTENDHTGSGDGYRRTQGDQKDQVVGKHIGYSSRPFRGEELDVEADTMGQLAWDAIVVIVHLNNPVDSLTAEQVRKLYAGEYETWEDVLE